MALVVLVRFWTRCPGANDKVAVGTEVELVIKGASVTVPRVTEIGWEIARGDVDGIHAQLADESDQRHRIYYC
jgi:hypothetical protein